MTNLTTSINEGHGHYALKGWIQCAGVACDPSSEISKCCNVVPRKCKNYMTSNGERCDTIKGENYTSTNENEPSCSGLFCTNSDADTCCVEKPFCRDQSLNCGDDSALLIGDTRCETFSCTSAADKAKCCQEQGSCRLFNTMGYNFPNYYVNVNESCTGVHCSINRYSDFQQCFTKCEPPLVPNENRNGCTFLVCPQGTVSLDGLECQPVDEVAFLLPNIVKGMQGQMFLII